MIVRVFVFVLFLMIFMALTLVLVKDTAENRKKIDKTIKDSQKQNIKPKGH